MKRILLGCISLSVLCISNSIAQGNKDTLSIKDCVQYALSNHENVRIYANKVAASKEKIRENRSSLLPILSGNASMDYNLKLQTSIIPAGALSNKDLRLQMGSKFSTGAYVEADQTVFDKSSWLNVKAARIDKDIADLNYRTSLL